MLLLRLVCGGDTLSPVRGGLDGAMALATLADMLQITDEVSCLCLFLLHYFSLPSTRESCLCLDDNNGVHAPLLPAAAKVAV
jgi:hypothetical protein